jgi:inner membrane protein
MAGDKLKNSVGLRLIIIGALSLILLIPAFMIQALITEREIRRNEAIFEVSYKWGSRQVIAGFILTVPYKKLIKDDKDNLVSAVEHVHFLLEDLTINAELFPEIRYRGIYEVVLYNSKLQLRGNFAPPDFNEFNIAPENIFWKDAFLSVGISDLKGIRDIVKIKWNEDELVANAGIESKDILESGISVKLQVATPVKNYVFAIDLDLNGSSEIGFVPVGKETKVAASSQWGNPSFVGEYLPRNDKFNIISSVRIGKFFISTAIIHSSGSAASTKSWNRRLG